MPRVYNAGENVDKWCDETDEGSSTLDVCASHYRDLKYDPHTYDDQLKPYNGDPKGDAGWLGEAAHPPYAEEDYECEICGKVLGDDDD